MWHKLEFISAIEARVGRTYNTRKDRAGSRTERTPASRRSFRLAGDKLTIVTLSLYHPLDSRDSDQWEGVS